MRFSERVNSTLVYLPTSGLILNMLNKINCPNFAMESFKGKIREEGYVIATIIGTTSFYKHHFNWDLFQCIKYYGASTSIKPVKYQK